VQVSSPTYGGQAVIEGVMIRGQSAMAVAVRRPEGDIVHRTERLGRLYTGPLRRVPFVRGLMVLIETLALGMRALTWSSGVASDELDEHGEPRPLNFIEWGILIGSLLVGLVIFFAGPVFATAWMDDVLPATWMVLLIEGLIRVGLLLGYIWLIGRSSDVRRVFQYHGAEHMTIAAYEDGRELNVAAIRRYPKEHPRCGTSFLLTVAFISVIVFAFAGTEPFWWRVSSRLILVPVIAGIGYEMIRFAGFHQGWPVVRWLFSANIALQKLTTSPPDDEQIQVAVHALREVRRAESERVGPS
jgi:uncharacterized protein YqhQ